jgi:hypothetical protein
MRGRWGAGLCAVAVAAGGLGAMGSGVSAAAPATSLWSVTQLRAEARALRTLAEGMHSQAVATGAGPVPVMTVHDPVGDVPSPQGDITGAGFAQNATSFAFGITVADPVDPATDPAWQAGGAEVAFALDRNNDGNPDFIILEVQTGPDTFMAGLVSATSPDGQACIGQFAYISGSGYRATFPNNCLPGSMSFRFEAAMVYSLDPQDPNAPVDYAPSSSTWSQTFTTRPAPFVPGGYWLIGGDGRVYGFGRSVAFPGITPNAAAIAGRQDGNGYWIVDRAGNVYAFGTAHNFGGSPSLFPGERITTMSPTRSQNGYWLFSNQGRAFAFGDASLYGDMSGSHLNGPIVASVASAGGHGYYMVGSDGGIFGFGDARFYGSTGGMRLNKPIVGIAPTPDNKGYWLVGADGGVFNFGDAPFRGSMGAVRLNQPIRGIVAYGNGYLMGGADGGVFDFSVLPFAGSLAGRALTAPIIGLAAFAG